MLSYQNLTLDELLNIAQDRNQLTDEARAALDLEIASRKVTTDEVRAYGRGIAMQKSREARQTERSKISYQNRNKLFLGKKNRHHDARKRIEEFDTTLWFVLGIPLVPLASYRIRRRFRRWWALYPSNRLHILETHPRDWQQIFLTWVKTAIAVLVLVCLIWAKVYRR